MSGFKHTGKVKSIGADGAVCVTLRQVEACEGCRAKGQCGAAKMNESGVERELRVVSPLASSLSVGDSVDVGITYRVGLIAVVATYVVPLILFVGVLIGAVACSVGEGLSALVAFGVTAIYYIGIYMCRKRFERVVVFELSRSMSFEE